MIDLFASAVAMVRPSCFGFNPETRSTNHFQHVSTLHPKRVQERAEREFDEMVKRLRASDISVLVLEDKSEPGLPDEIFPNNWFVSLPGELILCPMQAPGRRAERRQEHIDQIKTYTDVSKLTDWTAEENQNRFLEGTGSLILDHANKLAFACRSERTSENLFQQFCSHTGYKGFLFTATDRSGRHIYHTNVMMCMGKGFAVICEETISDLKERSALREIIDSTGREVISLTFNQVESFAGNMLQLRSNSGELFLVMSGSAHRSLSREQIKRIKLHSAILVIEASIIEFVGGGSVRCMMAELF